MTTAYGIKAWCMTLHSHLNGIWVKYHSRIARSQSRLWPNCFPIQTKHFAKQWSTQWASQKWKLLQELQWNRARTGKQWLLFRNVWNSENHCHTGGDLWCSKSPSTSPHPSRSPSTAELSSCLQFLQLLSWCRTPGQISRMTGRGLKLLDVTDYCNTTQTFDTQSKSSLELPIYAISETGPKLQDSSI